MPRHRTAHPTDRELQILRILWDTGPATVRQVHEAMNSDGATGYTTALKLMQIMAEKGLLTRDKSSRQHIYKAAVSEEAAQNDLLGNLINKAFAGSAEKLVLRALSANKVSPEELARIKKLLDEFKGE